MKHLPIYNSSFKDYLNDFTSFVKTKGYSRGKDCTFPTYVREFLFFMECKQITDIKEINAKNIIAYHEYLMVRPNQTREGGLSDSMIKSHLYSLRLFFDFLIDIEIIDSSPAKLPKFSLKKYKEKNILTVEEIKELYKVCESKQDKAFLSLAYGCGLRRSELENLDLSDVYLNKGIIVIRDSKNHKSRTIPLSDVVLQDVKEYIFYERLNLNKNFTPSLFINRLGLRNRGPYFNLRLKELIQKTKNQCITSNKSGLIR